MYLNEVLFGFYKNLYHKSHFFKEGLKNPISQVLIDDVEQESLEIIHRKEEEIQYQLNRQKKGGGTKI